MGRFRRGWELTGKSWQLLRANKQLFRFPVYGGLAALVPLALLVAPGIYFIDTHDTVLGIVLLVPGAYFAAFATIFFSVGLAACADELFHGREASVGQGLAVARSRMPQIAGWTALSTTVGLAVSVIEGQDNVLGTIAAAVIGTAWSLVTFLAIPVIATEGTGTVATLRRSAELLKSRWGSQIAGNLAIGGAVFLFGMLPALLLVAGGVALWVIDGNGAEIAAGAVLVTIGAVLLILSSLVIQALRQIFGVALLRFAGDGEAVGGFSAEELQSAVRSR